MARITVNESGTHPTLLLSTSVGNAVQLEAGNISGANVLAVTCLQDVTITASTGIYSWADFCSPDMNKLPTPADNEIAVNVVIDPTVYFGSNIANTGASNQGLAYISQNKIPVQFLMVWNNDANVANLTNGNISNISGAYYSSGTGYVTQLAPTASPEAPVYITPMTIAVDGTMYSRQS
jgi:hypothetical protein